jgi:hypothetical protein
VAVPSEIRTETETRVSRDRLVVDGTLQLLENVGLHLVATDAEFLRVGRLKHSVEAAPE